MIRIPRSLLEKMLEHLIRAYPEEGCGLLVGRVVNGVRVVEKVVPMRNAFNGTKRTRYSMDPLEYMAVEREEAQRGRIIIGVFHSHPDYPAIPSAYDLEHAFPEFTYVIASISGREVKGLAAWRLNEVLRRFEQEPMEILREG
jgi:proteasome lid subunit RPN8/RPN11